MKKGRYYFEIGKSTGDEETDFEVIEREEDVDFAALFKIMKMHLV